MTDKTQELESVPDDDQAPAVSPERPWYRRRTPQIIAACVVAGVVATAGGVQIARARTASVVADLGDQIETEATSVESAGQELWAAAQEATRVYAESDGHVTDETTRQAVADLLATDDAQITPVLSQATDGVPTSMIPTLPDGASIDDARSTLEDATISTRALTRYTTRLTDATAAVRESMAAWDLAQAITVLDQASADLTGSINNAGAVLTGSEGKVADNSVRQALADAITAATGIRDGAVDRTDLAAVQAATTALGEHKAAVDGATQPVVDAQAAWQAEQDAQAAPPPRQGGGTTPKSGGGTTPKSGGGTTPKSGGGTTPNNNTGGGSGNTGGQNGWVQTEDGFGSDLCGDELGNSWEC